MGVSSHETEEFSEGGSRIFRHSADSVKGFSVPAESCVYLECITAHIEQHLGQVSGVLHELISDQIHLDVLQVDPTPERPFYTLITSGMSDLPMATPAGAEKFRFAELMICLPQDWPMDEEGHRLDEKIDDDVLDPRQAVR